MPATPVNSIVTKMRAAEGAYRDGDFARALAHCSEILEVAPQHLPATVLRAMVQVNTGDLIPAAETLQAVASAYPDVFEAHLWLGIARQRQRRYEEAVASIRSALRLSPGNPAVLSTLGECYLEMRNGGKASGAFIRALSGRPHDSRLHHNLALAFQMSGEPEKAQESFERALELDPSSIITLVSLGQIYQELGRRSEAIAMFYRAHEQHPNTARGQIQLARALREEGKLDAAEAALQRALEIDPESVDALEVASNLMQQLGRFGDARTALDKAIEADPSRCRLYFSRLFCRKVGAEEQALVERMQEFLASRDLDAQERRYLNYGLAKAFHDLGQPEKAIRHYDAANRAMREILHDRPFERDIHVQEFDRKMAQFSPRFFQEHLSRGHASEVPVLIVGMIRSGTTLVEQILSAHPQIAGGGELLYWFRHAYEIQPNADGRIASADLARVQRNYLELLSDIDPTALRVTDKMPHNYMFLGQIHAAFPNARIIHCRRHPIDNCLSIYMTPYQIPLDFAHDRDNIVFVYREYLRLMEHWRAVLPSDRFIEVDYETLVDDPEPATRRLIDFVGLEWDEACLRPEDNERVVKTPSMWQVRQPVYKSAVARWKKYEPWIGAFAELRDVCVE